MKKAIVLVLLAACGDDGGGGGNDQEVITTVTLTFTPPGGTAITASFRDADGDGGNPAVIEPINLANGMTYATTVKFLNELESPAEDITLEVMDESDVHQVFYSGTAVKGPATSNTTAPLTHMYSDMDANGFPIGLANSFAASTGTGMMTVTLRHMPPVNDSPVKTGTLAETLKTMGVAALPGESDASVMFMVTVQ